MRLESINYFKRYHNIVAGELVVFLDISLNE
jgi:hypothetical protein